MADALATAAATRLVGDHDLRPGARVAFLAGGPGRSASEVAATQAAVASAAYGALRAGVVPVMINPLLSPAEQEAYLQDVPVDLIVADAADVARLTDPSGLAGRRRPELADVPLGRPMHFTSGTTGRSKGVWAGVLPEADASDYWRDEQQQWTLDSEDVLLNHGPLAHSAPLRFSFLAFLAGADVVFTGSFDAERTATAILDHAPTVAMAVPTHLERLLNLPGGPPPSSYRMLVHAGSTCPPDLKRRIHTWAGVEHTWEFLGSTEGQFTACRGTEWEDRPGTLGTARAGRRLHIDDGSLSGQAGVIWCEAPAVAAFEYFGDPAKTAQAWASLPGGGRAFTVGDLGWLDAAGYLYLHGRRTDLIVTGGVNVYPAEVEAELRTCPVVRAAAVFGRDDPHWGARVCAAIVLAPDASCADVTEWARANMAGYRRPKEITAVDALPLTSNGKVRRDGLAEWVAEQGRPASSPGRADTRPTPGRNRPWLWPRPRTDH